jgi:hypothetical protein
VLTFPLQLSPADAEAGMKEKVSPANTARTTARILIMDVPVVFIGRISATDFHKLCIM